MTALLRALSAESLKLRGTLAAWMCLIAPALVVALYVLQMAFMDYTRRPPVPGDAAWSLFAQNAMPIVNTTYMCSEMLRVSRVRSVFTACGTKARVVRVAAT